MVDFVLVPGAGGDGWYWSRLIGELEARGMRAVAVDLPADDESAGLGEYARAVVDAARPLHDVVVVAQSLGAFSAALAIEQLDVRMLVFVAAMIPADGETAGEWWTASGQQAAYRASALDRGADPDAFDDEDVFFHDLPGDVRAELIARGRNQQASGLFGEAWDAERWHSVPTQVVAAADDRLFPLPFMLRLARERAGVDAVVVPGGHLLALSHPRELADALVAFAAPDAAAGADSI
jgi:pimeloyl-ACP methyl ester carboxylesterase